MKLTQVIKLARNGELASLSKASKTDEKIIGYVNRALIALYNRFQLKTEEAFVTLVDNVHLYTLDDTDTNVTVNGSPMDGSKLVQIVEVWDEAGKLPLNDDNDPFSVFTPSYDQIEVSKAEDGNYLSVIYRASHDWIDYVDSGDGTAQEAEVRIPRPLLEALLMYVAYKAYDALDDAQTVKAEKYLARYREQLQEVEDEGLVPSDFNTIDINKRGFE